MVRPKSRPKNKQRTEDDSDEPTTGVCDAVALSQLLTDVFPTQEHEHAVDADGRTAPFGTPYPGLPVSEGIKIPEKLYGVKFGDLISFERDQWKLTVFSGDMWIVHGRARRCNHAVLPARESKTTRHRLAVNFRLGGSCTLDEEGNIKCFEEHVVEAAVGFAQGQWLTSPDTDTESLRPAGQVVRQLVERLNGIANSTCKQKMKDLQNGVIKDLQKNNANLSLSDVQLIKQTVEKYRALRP
ncbi:hypothetical protein NFJ02_03g105330 [Pycnococcus provasolii]